MHFLQQGHTYFNKATPPNSAPLYGPMGANYIQTTTHFQLNCQPASHSNLPGSVSPRLELQVYMDQTRACQVAAEIQTLVLARVQQVLCPLSHLLALV